MATSTRGRRGGVDGPEYAADTANGDRIGVVESRYEGSVYLRPPGGGSQWATAPEALRHLTREELARARVFGTPVGGGR
ncbi:hypothetical protein [Streptomyces sp. NPDC059994]|uniref:hypothetical protein n=1 Tax=Streptomyces sp. NPDC059994 TaxID=3347029 RepID=UPI0036C54C21